MKKKTIKKKPVTFRVPRTRNGETETESQHMGKIRAALRFLTRYWKPKQYALKNASKTYKIGGKKRVEYQCAICLDWYTAKSVEVDHIVAAGSLKNYADLPSFCERLFVEDVSLLRVLCIECHQGITHKKKEAE